MVDRTTWSWNPFRSRRRRRSPRKSERNRVDELADRLEREGRADDLEAELVRLDRASLSAGEQESWWHLHGIVAFRGGRDEDALERFQRAHAAFPGSARIRFSLGQQRIRTGAPDEGFALFRTATFPEIPREFALAEARYAYLWDRYRDGLAFIRPFLDAYRELRILDDHFLYVRGLPFFGQWWSYLAALSILDGDVTELEDVTASLAKRCHGFDFEHLALELAAYRDDAPALLLRPLEARLAAIAGGALPTGHTRMGIAVIQARSAPTLAAARDVLSDVTLSPLDRAWLDDVRTLALAEAAARFGDAALEAQRVDAFLARQPLLFEPDIALNVHLLRYQERLKPRVAIRARSRRPR